MLKLPDVFPHAFTKIKGGPPMPNQSAIKPCFTTTGIPVGDQPGKQTNPAWIVGGAPACPPTKQPEFTGSKHSSISE